MTVNHGFVVITGTKQKGRIGRYTKQSTGNEKARVYFGYEGDEQKYTNYTDLAEEHLSNTISMNDLVDRYYIIKNTLQKIEFRAHPTIRPYSALHRGLLCEYNLVRFLFSERLNIKYLQYAKHNTNVFLFYSFYDTRLFCEFAADLEYHKYNVAAESHEMINDTMDFIDDILKKCNLLLFMLSQHSLQENWLKEEYYYCKDKIGQAYHDRLKFIKIDESELPEYVKKHFDISNNYKGVFDDILHDFVND